MKLTFHQHGKQFLFYTFCLSGRPQRLSRIEAGAKRPLLTAEGEAVHALMRSLHRLLSEGRLLILSPFSEAVPASPISRANCERMNALAADMAARASTQEPVP